MPKPRFILDGPQYLNFDHVVRAQVVSNMRGQRVAKLLDANGRVVGELLEERFLAAVELLNREVA